MNIIELFQRGNQELFHSSFIGWLLNKEGEHGFGNRFAKKLFKRISFEIGDKYDVYTESRDRNSRYDILIEPQTEGTKLVLENKVKSFGYDTQISSYKEQGHRVAFLAFLEETIECAEKHDVIYYRDILEDLETEKLINSNHYHFLIREYIQFLRNHLSLYSTIKNFCLGGISWGKAVSIFKESLKDTELKDNDIRTYNYFFYYNFERYLKTKSSELILGDLQYDDAEKQNKNTMWHYEKNMQGSPFMEALIFNPNQKGMRFKLNADLMTLYKKKKNQIAPRVEIWLDLQWLLDKSEDFPEAGKIMMGTWSDELKGYLLENEPYRSTLSRMGPRNFHYEQVPIKDLIFENLEKRIKKMMMHIGSFIE